MLRRYKTISIIYGGSGAEHAQKFKDMVWQCAKVERYPLRPVIVMDKILTGELFSKVTGLFRESEFCVALLTADDCCLDGETKKYRLRQNVVFELGMALYRLGRERCILLADFNVNDTATYELPSDLLGVSITTFQKENREDIFWKALSKILEMSKQTVDNGWREEKVPQYDHLLDREEYLVDYENIFSGYGIPEKDGNEYLQKMLEAWLEEMDSFPHIEERCIYFLERAGFVPMFGKWDWVVDWCHACSGKLLHYNKDDLAYCTEDQREFLTNATDAVSEYLQLKLNPSCDPAVGQISHLIEQMEEIPLEDSGIVNPLVATMYLDYLGLSYMSRYDMQPEGKKDLQDLKMAIACFERIMKEYVDRVDMGLSIFKGFLCYNLARAYFRLHQSTGEAEHAAQSRHYFKKSTRYRRHWLDVKHFNTTMTSALSFEYFISKIDQTMVDGKLGLKTQEQLIQDYKNIETELQQYMRDDAQYGQLYFIKDKVSKFQGALL